MILLVDVGNTRIKWASVKDDLWLRQGSVRVQQAAELGEQWRGLGMPGRIAGCCVADPKVARQIESLAQEHFALPVDWLQVTHACCGVESHYKNTGKSGKYESTLGADRWASLIAAHHHYPGNSIVVNVGTAMTVDALTAQGAFLGGMILPGVRLMQTALSTHTARLPYVDGQYDPFPKTTMDAIYTGALTALSGSVDTMAHRLGEHCHQASIRCIISGGDARLISPYLHCAGQVTDELVLLGLKVIALSDAQVWMTSEKTADESVDNAL